MNRTTYLTQVAAAEEDPQNATQLKEQARAELLTAAAQVDTDLCCLKLMTAAEYQTQLHHNSRKPSREIIHTLINNYHMNLRTVQELTTIPTTRLTTFHRGNTTDITDQERTELLTLFTLLTFLETIPKINNPTRWLEHSGNHPQPPSTLYRKVRTQQLLLLSINSITMEDILNQT